MGARSFRRGAATALTAALLWGLIGPPDAGPSVAERPPLGAFRGLGTWVDIYDTRQLEHPRRAVRRMHARGVRTLYLETSSYRRKRVIVRPRATEQLLHAAHARGMKVVAWYVPGFRRLWRDARRSLAAIRFRTSRGEGFDAFGLDAEASVVRSPERRTARLLRLSRRIRSGVGPSYPLAAIIPSPRGMELLPDYWPGFPYRDLAGIYDVLLPMGYFTFRVSGMGAARSYTRRNVEIIRRETGIRSVPIHAVGGIAEASTRAEVRGFVRAVREHGLLGASLYAFGDTRPGAWTELEAVPVNLRQWVPLPVELGYEGALGNIPGADRRHPKEVFYLTDGRAGDWRVGFEAYDVEEGEVEVWVNWRRAAEAAPTADGGWGGVQWVGVPDALLRDGRRNYIHFVARGNFGAWSEWGVRGVALEPAGP